MITGIDHVIILGEELEAMISQYERLGFTVTPGGKHPRFTHNALIPFQDGSYLELIAFYEQPEPGGDETHRWHRHLATGAGLVDFAVGALNVEDVQSAARERGVEMAGPVQGGRMRLDGIEIRWRSVVPEGENTGALPFVIEDQTDRTLRVPVEASAHANGVTGIHSVVVAVRDLDAAATRFTGLSGVERTTADAARETFEIGDHRIDLIAAHGSESAQELIDNRGDSVYALNLMADADATIDPSNASNARIRLVAAQG